MILLCANMCPKSSISDIYIIDVVFCCVRFLYILLRGFIMFAVWFFFLFFFFFFYNNVVTYPIFSVPVSIQLLYIFVTCFCFIFCLVSFCVQYQIVIGQKKNKCTQKINKIKTPVNFSFAAIDMEKLKITVEYVLFCILPVISKKGFNTTLFPGGLPPQY